jgi:hypothetical protein
VDYHGKSAWRSLSLIASPHFSYVEFYTFVAISANVCAAINLHLLDQNAIKSRLKLRNCQQPMTAPGCGGLFKRFCLVGHRQARIDICNRWRRAAVCLWFLGLCACFGILYPFSKVGGGYSSACLPDGRFGLEPGKFRYVSILFWSKYNVPCTLIFRLAPSNLRSRKFMLRLFICCTDLCHYRRRGAGV